MSDNSSNPLDGLPTPQKAAKPSPLKSDPGHQPQQGERWWLQSSIKPEGEEPEGPETDEEVASEPESDDIQGSDIDPLKSAETTPEVGDLDQHLEDENQGRSSNLPTIVGVLVVIALVVAFLFSGGES